MWITLLWIGWVVGVLGVIFVGGCILSELKDNHSFPMPKKVTWFDGSWKLP